MGTRFLLTQESPVPRATIERYFKASVEDVFVTTKVDGMPQRVIRNELVEKLESSGPVALLATALQSGLAYRKLTGASIRQLLGAAFRLQHNDKLTRSQMLMAANAPILIQRAMVEGRPSEGVLPSGQVAGLITDLPTCAELIARIISQAEERLAALASGAHTERKERKHG
jgi:nitronate monooxygenase